MTIENLQCFILVAENLSFARAAEALYISQPAVTKQISTLEQELGVTLFLRSTRHVELTPAGMSFYKDAKDIVLKAQIAISRAKRKNSVSASLRIGLSSPMGLFMLSPILERFHLAYPEVQPHIVTPGYQIAQTLFLENKLDLLFYYKENMPKKAGICFHPCTEDTFSCLIPARHPLSAKPSVTLAELAEETFVACNPLNAPSSTAALQKELLQNHPAEQILYCDSIEISHCMVAAGMGISILPSLLCLKQDSFVSVPLQDTPPLSFGVFYHKNHNNTALEQFLHFL